MHCRTKVNIDLELDIRQKMFKVNYPYFLSHLNSFQDLELKSPISGSSVKLSRLVAISVSPMLANILVDDLTHETADESIVIVDGASIDDLNAFVSFSISGVISSKDQDKTIFHQLGINFNGLNIVLEEENRNSIALGSEFSSLLLTQDIKREEHVKEDEILDFEEFEIADENFDWLNEESFVDDEEEEPVIKKSKIGRPRKVKRKLKDEADDDDDIGSSQKSKVRDSDDGNDFVPDQCSSPEPESKQEKPKPKRKAPHEHAPQVIKSIKGFELLKEKEKEKYLAKGHTEQEWNIRQRVEESSMIKRRGKKNGIHYTYFYPKHDYDMTEFPLENYNTTYECWECDEEFVKPIERVTHYIAMHTKRPEKLYCQFCHKRYPQFDKEGLVKHEEEHRQPENQNCFQCGWKFPKGKFHAKKHFDKVGPYHATKKCLQCDYELKSYQDHKDHVRTQHGGMFKFVCGVCPLLFDSDLESRKHKHTEHMEETERKICNICGQNFDKWHLRVHLLSKHGEKSPCKVEGCDYVVAKYLEKEHMTNYHNPKICDDCGKQFRGRTALSSHRRNAHTEKSFQCQYCPKSFRSNNALKEHLNIHTGEAPFKCKFCGIGFKSSSNKFHHQRSVHFGIKREDFKRLKQIHGSAFQIDHENSTETNYKRKYRNDTDD